MLISFIAFRYSCVSMQVLRERMAARFTGGGVHIGGAHGLQLANDDEEDGGPANDERGEEEKNAAETAAAEHEGEMQIEKFEIDKHVVDPSTLPSAFMLFYLAKPGLIAYLLERLLVNLSNHGPSREAILQVILKLLEGARREETRSAIPRVFAREVNMREDFPPDELLGLQIEERVRRVDTQQSSENEMQVADPSLRTKVPMKAVRAILSTLVHLSTNSKLVKFELLKGRGTDEKLTEARDSLFEGLVGLLQCQQYTRTGAVLDELLCVLDTASMPLDRVVDLSKNEGSRSKSAGDQQTQQTRTEQEEKQVEVVTQHGHIAEHGADGAHTHNALAGQGRWVTIPPTVLRDGNLRLLCEVLLLKTCSDESFQRVSRIVSRLAKLASNRRPLLAHLRQVSLMQQNPVLHNHSKYRIIGSRGAV
jgi:hypothetical protein